MARKGGIGLGTVGYASGLTLRLQQRIVMTSLAVHSAFRHIRTAAKQDIPIAILNVGETMAEIEGFKVLKIEAPAGPTLDLLMSRF